MPRYLFHIVDEKSRPNSVRDGEGAMLRDATEARKEAVGLAQDIAKHGLDGSTKWKIVVTDEHGDNILVVPLAEVYTFRARAWSAFRGLFSKPVYRSPRTLAWSIAAGVIGVQTIALAMLLQEPNGTYQTASAPSRGAVVVIRFVGKATVEEITSFMETHRSSIVDGPRAGGLYRIRLSHTALPKDEFARLVGRMSQAKVVDFVATEE